MLNTFWQRNRKHIRLLVRTAAAACGVLLLYALSYGPLIKAYRGNLPSWAKICYQPVSRFVPDRLHRVYESYLEIWMDEANKPTHWTCGRKFQNRVASTDRIVIRDGGFDCCEPVAGQKVLVEITNKNEIDLVLKNIEFGPVQPRTHCMCCGYPGIDWYRGRKRLALTAIQHGEALRWRDFPGDAWFTAESSLWLMRWLIGNGIKSEEFKINIRHGEQKLEARQAIKPHVPETFWNAVTKAQEISDKLNHDGKQADDLVRKSVNLAYPDSAQLHRELFRLIGSLPMDWVVVNTGEQRIALTFLIGVPEAEMDAALRKAAVSQDLLVREGAARFVFHPPHASKGEVWQKRIELLAPIAYANPFPENRLLLMTRLTECPEIPATDILASGIEDPDEAVRRMAVKALGQRKSSQARSLLTKVAEDKASPRSAEPLPKSYGESHRSLTAMGPKISEQDAARSELQSMDNPEINK